MNIAEQFNNSLLFEFYGNLLTEKQKSILNDFLNNNLSLTEIAESYGVTRQAINDLIKRTIKILQSYEDKLGLLAKFKNIKSKVEKASLCIDSGDNQKVKEYLNDILEDYWWAYLKDYQLD